MGKWGNLWFELSPHLVVGEAPETRGEVEAFPHLGPWGPPQEKWENGKMGKLPPGLC